MRRIARTLGTALACLALLGMASQAFAESKLKNIKVLTGKSDEEIKKLMGEWTKSLGVKCLACHKSLKTPDLDDSPAKEASRAMYQMDEDANAAIKTDVKVACYVCHRGALKIEKVDDNVTIEKGKEDLSKKMKEMVVMLNQKRSAARGKDNPRHGGPRRQGGDDRHGDERGQP
ncbi:MAG: photosynthetic reaction center cytochrome c subunit [Candidatus Wallbacteria bacterium]|nr:photosynthetic reaction center cytochrome c subunit [Candidatus Wallbacteria bacterium]